MKTDRRITSAWRSMALGLALAAGGCSALLPKAEAPPALHALGTAPAVGRARAAPTGGLTLIVATPQTDAGYDSPAMVYLRRPGQLEHFAHHVWVDTPARMLAPLIVDAVADAVSAATANAGAAAAPSTIRVAVPPAAAAAGELRLVTEIVRLQQDFGASPSQVRFTLRATLLDDATRRVLATQEFDASMAAPSDDPEGGVIAANLAVRAVLQELAGWCSRSAGLWRRDAGAGTTPGEESRANGRQLP